MVARARCRALFTETTVVSSSSATSEACQHSTSRKMSTARCRGGRFCRAEMKASRMVSCSTTRPAGSASAGTGPSPGNGSTQAESGSVATGSVLDGTGVDRSMGMARRLRLRSMSRQTLVAIRYSHERSADRPSNRSNACQARTMASCTASSASCADPSIR